jgi:exopolysaccharide biosynthesis polyprenyl glycosylphosphotransferase
MKLPNPVKIFILVIGDIAALYAALVAALYLRYGTDFAGVFYSIHFGPFSIIFPLWLLVFYIAGLYDLPRLRNNLEFLQTLYLTVFVNALVTIAVFYLVPAFGITPKTNLFIFIALFVIIESVWRRTFNRRASFREGLNRVLLLDRSPRAKEIHDTLAANPQLGYAVKLWLDAPAIDEPERIRRLIGEHHITLVVVPTHLKHETSTAKLLYELLASGIEVRDLPDFYEIVFRKVPIPDIAESWFVEHHVGQRKFYDDLKRGLEFVGALVIGIALLPLELLIAFLIMLTSPGPAVYSQVRVGKRNREFTLYKFRTMRVNAEQNGAQWAAKNDARVTGIGKILRATHLDELPQLWNVVRNELSFVGPRPERPEFVRPLAERIPYFEIRHIVNPGITGWAQINYRYGASAEDANQKLQYDLYYLKNRSVILDIAIIIKTIKSFFVNNE